VTNRLVTATSPRWLAGLRLVTMVDRRTSPGLSARWRSGR